MPGSVTFSLFYFFSLRFPFTSSPVLLLFFPSSPRLLLSLAAEGKAAL